VASESLKNVHKGKFRSGNGTHFPAVYGLFNDAVSILHYTASNGRIIDDRFERILKEVILA
jgi:hypothetical protein